MYLCMHYFHLFNISMEQTSRLVETITKGIQEKKGADIVVADLQGIDGTICNYFVICQGSSPAQVEAITESVGDYARNELGEKHSGWPWTMATYWYTSSCPTSGRITTWSTSGTMHH